MKITKEYLRTIIKEELSTLYEVDVNLQKTQRDLMRKNNPNLANASDAEIDNAIDLSNKAQTFAGSSPNASDQDLADVLSKNGANKANPVAVKMANKPTSTTDTPSNLKINRALKLATKK